MPKLNINELTLPLFSITGKAFREEGEKNWWINASGPSDLPKLDGFRIVETGRSFDVKEIVWERGRGKFQFKGIPEAALNQDVTLIPESWPVQLSPKALFVPLGPGNQKLSGPSGTLKSPLFESRGKSVSFKRIDTSSGRFVILVSSRKDLPVLVGAPYSMEDEKGNLVQLALLAAEPLRERDVDELIHKVYRFPGEPSITALYSLNLRLRGWVELPPPLWQEEFTESFGIGGVRIMKLARENLTKKLLRLIKRPGGVPKADLAKVMELPDAVLGQLLRWCEEDKKLIFREGFVLPVEEASTYLSPIAKKLWRDLEFKGLDGIHLSALKDPVVIEQFRGLIRMNLILGLEEDWVISEPSYKKAISLICTPENVDKTFTLAELKELMGPTRRLLIALLNRMEMDGNVVREESLRRIVKTLES